MKYLILFSLMFTLSLSFAASLSPKAKTQTVKMSKDDQLKMVLAANDFLFDQLLNKDQAAVEASAKQLIGAIKKTDVSELKALREAKGLEAISKANTKDANLEAYAKVMPMLVELVKTHKPAGYGIFYCPMIKKDWVQNVGQHPGVTNVFAQYMLECGEKR